LFLLACAVRIVFVKWGWWYSGDSDGYLTLAKNLALHHVFSLNDGPGVLLPTAVRPPLYPFLIAALGWGNSPAITAVQALQILLGSATTVLVYFIAVNSFPRSVALIAAVGMALAPMTSHFTAVVLTETLFTFLVTLGIFFWGHEKAVPAGLSFGLAMLTRPVLLAFILLLAVLSLLPPWRIQRRKFLIILCVTIAVSSVWTARNLIVFQKLFLVQSKGYGVNLFAGTIDTQIEGNPNWDSALEQLQAAEGSSNVEGDIDKHMAQMAIQRIMRDPLDYLKIRAKQYPRLFIDTGDYLLGSRNIIFSEALRERRPFVIVIKLGFVLANIVALCLALVGLFSERHRFVSLSHIVLFPIFLLLIHLPMWIESRYSLPMMPLQAILTAAGLLAVIQFARQKCRGWRS
jgi:4-amino-4-deoxy-L-arabinose transferase-like glycosyltransferase